MLRPTRRGAAPRSPTVLRSELIERLASRFDARVTTVVGGAGAGKTTLLAQALRSDDDGLDVWYPCGIADRDDDRLLATILERCAEALGERPPPPEIQPASALEELIVASSPRQICLVLDDVHLLESEAPLEKILAILPANGHLLLSGRRLPPLGIARLDARGEVAEIRQGELMMTDVEIVEFARQRGVDASVLESADGWPAFVELAAQGGGRRPHHYLEQEALQALGDSRRRALAKFAYVGGGDDEIAQAVTGMPLEEVIDGLPLVRWTDDHAQLHDLWIELLDNVLTDDDRRAAAGAVTDIHFSRGDYDRAMAINTATAQWPRVEEALAGAVRLGIDGGITAGLLSRWIERLPDEVRDRPVGRLVRGVVERERDPTSNATWDHLEYAADGFAELGDAELELVALLQLGYVARMSGDAERLRPIIERAASLAERYPPARPFLAFGDAWTALAEGRPDRQLAAMETIVDADLPLVWQRSRDHLIAHALFNLGRPDEGLERAPKMDESISIPIPGALVTHSQCLWWSGRPEAALAARPLGLDARHGARDRFIAGGWIAMMETWAGHLAEAQAARRIASTHAGDVPAAIVSFQMVGLDVLHLLVKGDETAAAEQLSALLELVPLGGGVSEQALRNLISLPYVLVPASRDYWDAVELGPSIDRSREIARGLVEARSGDLERVASLEWSDPGMMAATLPVPWAIELALYGVESGRAEGRRLAGWLCEHWGQSARDELHRWLEDPRLGLHAADVSSRTPMPPRERIALKLLGTTRLDVDGYPTADPDWRRERARALLVWLVLHRSGVRDQIAGTLWPDLDAAKAHRNLRTTLNYLHRVLEPSRGAGEATWFVRIDGPIVHLDPSIDVDVWQFNEILDAADREERAGRVSAALPMLLRAVGLYGGDLAPDLDHEWLDLERIHLRSRFVRATCRAAELLVAKRRADEAVEVAQAGLAADPWHGRSYAALASAYEELGDLTSARSIRARAESQLDGF